MINGAHAIVYSRKPDADRAFFRDVLGFPNVDVGDGWLIFGLPPSEVAVHPSEKNDVHEFYLMCDDVRRLVAGLKKKKIACAPIHEERWGSITQVTLPQPLVAHAEADRRPACHLPAGLPLKADPILGSAPAHSPPYAPS